MTGAFKTLPRNALGLGLRPVFYRSLFERWPALDYVEIITENFLDPGPGLEKLEQVKAKYPIVLHGLGLNLLGHEPLDEAYVQRVKTLADRLQAPFVSDHLCWTASHGLQHHDLLPAPFVQELVDYAAERAARAQEILGRPLGLENLSSYTAFQSSTLSEWSFYAAVIERSQCWAMLDINNVYVSSVNQGFDAHEYLAAVDYSRVLQVHLAGCSGEGQGDGPLIDTHDAEVSPAVWSLYERAWKLGGPFPTLIEWDSKIPPLHTVLKQLELARAYQL
jgi:uncharacterized protein